MPNRLAHESSPYLLQHQHNPVDWYPWGSEALSRAQQEEKPIFLSIGYAACHWCHVMEHESFEDAKIAEQLNTNFVCIKVDREERPDLDQIYMNAVQLLTGHGGWPMSVFLTPERQPFFGGTYWPPEPRPPMPGFQQVLAAVMEAWEQRREQALQTAAQLTENLRQIAAGSQSDGEPPMSIAILPSAVATLERIFDFSHGGFGGAPKFPHSVDLQVMLREWRREPRDGILSMVRLTLDKMAAGGIYDQLGGGFARYSVDERWLVPHFEKMLYDNALLCQAYLEGFQATGDESYATVVRETLDYLLRDMTDPEGGFYSTEDADSEGVEGKFYVWTLDELQDVLGAEAAATFARVYDVSDVGNFEGKNILNMPKTISQIAQLMDRNADELSVELAASRSTLLEVRNRRVRPGRDDKVLVSWNGLAIDALAKASQVLGEPRYLRAAEAAAQFLLSELRDEEGQLLHTWRQGRAKLRAYLDDYAALANGLVSLYEAGFDRRHLDAAAGLADEMLDQFQDDAAGGFFYTGHNHEQLIARNKDFQDGSVPSGNSLAATLLVRLGKLTGQQAYLTAAERTIQAAAPLMERAPAATGQMLLAVDLLWGDTLELVLGVDPASPTGAEILAALHRQFIPNKVLALIPDGPAETSSSLQLLLTGKTTSAEGPALYICRSHACQEPIHGKQPILDALAALRPKL